ncbi:MAG: GDSL-type esterase/lipase family protein [Acidobacteriota bacterium]|nr:GDSL-type esterase/lipase family protein [Acidobacteriota bacterium]
MRALALLTLLAVVSPAQNAPGIPGAVIQAPLSETGLSGKDAAALTTRMLQLMESTAVATPGLTQASEPVKRSGEATFTAMQAKPLNPALTYQFMNEVRAYLALASSMPRPHPFPVAADLQYAELRESLQRLQLHFEAILQTQNQAERKKDSDPNNLKRYAEANTKLPPPGRLPRVVFMGDSITDFWRLNEYFTGRDFINRGIGGQTTLQMLARFRQDVEALNPKAVVVLGGANDIAAGISVAQIEENLATMGELAKARGIRPVFASITPVSDYHKDVDPAYAVTPNRPPATIQAIDTWLRSLCQSQGYVYLDYYSAMVDTAGQLQADLSDDGLHPNSKGYRVMSPVALEAIGRALAGQGDSAETPSSKRHFRLPGR